VEQCSSVARVRGRRTGPGPGPVPRPTGRGATSTTSWTAAAGARSWSEVLHTGARPRRRSPRHWSGPDEASPARLRHLPGRQPPADPAALAAVQRRDPALLRR